MTRQVVKLIMSKDSALLMISFAVAQVSRALARPIHLVSTMVMASVISIPGVNQPPTYTITAIGVQMELQIAPLPILAATSISMEAMR